MSKNSPILWIELDCPEDVDIILRHSARVWNLQAKAIMYPPSELFRTIKSIELNCKKQKEKDPDLRYNVRLGVENIELHIKHLGDYEYCHVNLDIFGPFEEPNLEKTTVHTTMSDSPPKGRILKRQRNSPENDRQ